MVSRPRSVCTITARMGSTRLPGKVLMDIDGKPHLARLVDRVRKSKVDEIIVATTENDEDDAIIEWAFDYGVQFYRGPQDDVLARVVGAFNTFNPSPLMTCVRVWGDCPLIDPCMIDKAIDIFEDQERDEMDPHLVMGPKTRTFPHGVSPHVTNFMELDILDSDIGLGPLYREHDTLALYDESMEDIIELTAPKEWDCKGQRLQIDYWEDWAVVNTIYHYLGEDFDTGDIVNLLREKPWIREINKHCQDKPVR